MIYCTHKTRFAQRGVVLVSSLLLLIVVTIIALSMFRSFGIQEKIAGNMREKQRALQAAESAEVFAEVWLEANAATSPAVTCPAAAPLNANLGQGQICSQTLEAQGINVTQVPWPFGVTFVPPLTNMQINQTTSVANVANPTYFGLPTFYITDLGASPDLTKPGEIYQVDAYSYGGSANTVAVIESTYNVYTSSTCVSC
jgi:type IV pilus assembly protein PilX